MRLLTGLILPEQEPENRRAIGRGEYRKLLAEEPWRDWCNFPLPCTCQMCNHSTSKKQETAP